MSNVPKLKILLVVHDMSSAGAPKVILDLFNELRSQLDIRVIALDEGALEGRFQILGDLKMIRYAMYRFHPLRLLAKLRQAILIANINRWVREFGPDVIYLNSAASLPVLRQLSLPNTPVVLHVHEMGWALRGFWKQFGNLIHGRDIHYTTVSNAAKRSFCEETGVKPDIVDVIHACIPEEDYQGYPIRNGSPPSEAVIGGAGTVEWRKGLQLWLIMAAQVTRILGPGKARFMWVGTRPGTEETSIVEEQANILGLKEIVEWVPLTSRPLEYFSKTDIFTLTSWEDPCPLVVLENMMLGNPVVTFAGNGGAAEEIGDAGVIVETFSPEAMAREVATLVQSPDRRSALGRAARIRIQEQFTCNVQAPLIYQSLLAAVGKNV